MAASDIDANLPGTLPQLGNVWINTAIHALSILACWVMVKTRFLFRWVPH